MQKVHFQHSDKEWETPDSLFKPLEEEFNITLDVCATSENTKCNAYYDKKSDGLKREWSVVLLLKGSCWMNPPYGKGIEKWVKKAYDETFNGVTTVALLPARTDTQWFHDYVNTGDFEIRFLKGRIKFVGAEYSAPFPSMVVIFSPKKENKLKRIWKKLKW